MTDGQYASSVINHHQLCGERELVGKSLSAFCTSSLQNVSAVCSLHSFSETVLFLSLTLFGLVSSEHNGTSLMLESEAYRPQDTMHAFYSDNIYYIRNESFLSRVFFILGNFFFIFLGCVRAFRENFIKKALTPSVQRPFFLFN